MKTVRVMAIIGIIWFVLAFFGLASGQQAAYNYASRANIDNISGWGYLAILYALAFSIVVVVKVKKPVQLTIPISDRSTTAKLLVLNELRQKDVLSEDEFEAMKLNILKS